MRKPLSHKTDDAPLSTSSAQTPPVADGPSKDSVVHRFWDKPSLLKNDVIQWTRTAVLVR